MTEHLFFRLKAYGATLDAEIRESGAIERVRRNVLAQRNVLTGIPWQRVAAAVLVAGMLGGAVDLVLPRQSADTVDVAIVDPLYPLDAGDNP